MKLKYTAILLFCLLLTGCSNTTNQEAVLTQETSDASAENDLTNVSPKPQECTKEVAQTDVEENTVSEEYPILFEVDNSMEREYNYDSLTDLQRDATDTFCAKVISAEAKMPGSLVYTKYEMKITEVFSGDLTVGDTINVAVLGGIVKADEYFAKGNMYKSFENEYTPELLENSYIKITCDGAWLMETDKEYLLFTQYISYDGDMVYSPLNTWQSIFEKNNDDLYQRYESETYRQYRTLSSPEYKPLQFSPDTIRE